MTNKTLLLLSFGMAVILLISITQDIRFMKATGDAIVALDQKIEQLEEKVKFLDGAFVNLVDTSVEIID